MNLCLQALANTMLGSGSWNICTNFAASGRSVCAAVPTFMNLANSNLHPGLTHIPTSRKLLLTKRWSASAKLSLGFRHFQRCILQELQRTRTLVTQNHVDILVGHYPATRSSCDKGAKSSSTIKPNTSTISSLNGTFLLSLLDRCPLKPGFIKLACILIIWHLQCAPTRNV